MSFTVEPKILQGFMELLPREQVVFNRIYDKIREVYERFGFLPIDTPTIERSDVLLAKAGGETEKPAKTGTQGATNEARIAFLESYGWQVEPEPVKTQQVTVPADPSEVFLRYNELQISQGYDLLQYSGKELTRYVYRITNYPDESGVYYATLLVKDGQVVGADVSSSAKTGVMHGLKMPE